MKKFIALILAVLYITASSGVVLNVHYCMGKVSSVKIDNFNKAVCKCGSKAEDGSCCKTEFKVVKLDNEHKASVVLNSPELPVSILPTSVSLIDVSKLVSQRIAEPAANAPPLDPFGRIYLKNRVFRI